VADQWDDTRVQRWLGQSEGIDRQLAPVTDALFAAADLQGGERVLDVGCGHGPTTRLAARAVGRGGSVTGLDLADAMLRAAAAVPPGPEAAPIEWINADAVDWDPVGSGVDPHHVVISRYGVMFFSDPVKAFTNIRASAPEGRLAIATWAHRHRSDMFEVPLAAALDVMARRGVAVDPPEPDEGAFSLCTAQRLTDVLTEAGWSEVDTVEHGAAMVIGGGTDIDTAARAGLDLGPTRVVTTGQPEDLRAEVIEAIADAYRSHLTADGHVALGGTFLITTASA